ncbi:MAG: hypothetical protein EYC69_02200 [Bacteroidetes bacterium]|nr:MAG: hypothetical protein EYC69_02200 [Bacteroidota bacterium]
MKFRILILFIGLSLTIFAQDSTFITSGVPPVRTIDEPKVFYESPFFNTIVGVVIATVLTFLGQFISEKKQKRKEKFQQQENLLIQLKTIKSNADSLIHSIIASAAGLMQAFELEHVNIHHSTGFMQQSINNRLAAQNEYYKIQSEFIRQVYNFMTFSKEENLFQGDIFKFRHKLLDQPLDRRKYSMFDSYIQEEVINTCVQPIINNMNQVIMKIEKDEEIL